MPPVARLARLVLWAVVALAGWLLLPAVLGGGTAFLSTSGISMQPLLHGGDLAVVRAADDYDIGDVVAYHSDTLDTTVLHRIVGVTAGAFTTQGDNNSWTDPDHPTAAEIRGRMALSIPHGGQVLAQLRSPLVLVPLGLALIVVTGLLRRRRRTVRTRSGGALPAGARTAVRRLVPAASAAAAVALLGGIAAFLVPVTETVEHPGALAVQGTYTYAGVAAPGVTYPDGSVDTGEPVWRSLASAITVGLQQTVPSADATVLGGSLRLDVAVTTPDGWSAPLASGPTASLADGALTAAVPLDLDAAGDLAARHYAEIGTAGDAAVVTVTPVGGLTGQAQGRPFTAGGAAPLSFALTSASLVTSADADLAPTTTIDLATTTVQPRSVALLGISLPVSLLRGVACLVLAAALIVLAAGGALRLSRDPAAALRNGARTIRVAAVPAGAAAIEVPEAAALRRIAEQRDTLVLYSEDVSGAAFWVQDGATTFRFRPAPIEAPHAGGQPRVVRRPAPTLGGLFTQLARI